MDERLARENEDLYARGYEAGYLAAYRDVTHVLLLNPRLTGRGLLGVVHRLVRSVRAQRGSRAVA